MRVGRIAFCAVALCATAAAAETGKMRRVGPWNVGAFTEKGQFQHCIMARPEKGGVPGFGLARGRSYLTLAMFSDKWKLDPGSTYPVTLVAGGVSEEFQAKVESATTVGVAIGGREAFVSALFSATVLEVRTPASTLRLPMDRSAAALRTLNECYQVEAQVASNPFGPAPNTPSATPENPFKPAAPAAAAPKAAAPAVAPPPDAAYLKARADCEQDADADRQIAGCTAVIESGRETREVMGIALANRAFGYGSKGDQAKALASFSQAIELYPAYANARWGRGDVQAERSAWDEAILDYDAALTIDPKDDYSRKRRAEAEAKKTEALAAAAKAPSPAPPAADVAGAFGRMGEIVVARGANPAPPAPQAVTPTPKGPALAAAPPVQAPPPAPVAAAAVPVQPAAAPSETERLAQIRQEAVAAIEVIGLAPQTCGFEPVMKTIATIARVSQLSPEMLETAPFAEWRSASAQRLATEAAADKDGFCARAWAQYGEAGQALANVFTR